MSEHDFDFEPQPGLPARLPLGETLLWQGRPAWRRLAFSVFHLRAVAVYFIVLAAWAAFAAWWDGAAPPRVVAAALPVVVAGLAAGAILAWLAWLTARATIYSITSKRVILRIGIALPTTFNLPFAVIGNVALKTDAAGFGDIALTLMPGNRLAYLVLWPHIRPWRFGNAQPSLRALPDGSEVATLLGRAIAASLASPSEGRLNLPASPIAAPIPAPAGGFAPAH